MQLGFIVSLLMHTGILVWAFATIQSTPPLRLPEPEPVEVALVTEDAIVRLKQGDRDSKNLETQQSEHTAKDAKKELPKQKLERTAPPAAAEPPPPPPEAKSEPPPEPVKAEAPKPEPPKPEPPRDPIAEKLASLPPQPEGPSLEQIKQQEDEKRRAEEAQKAEEARKAEEAQKAEEAKKAEDARKIAEKKKADDKKKADEAARKKREQQKKIADAKRAQEAKKKQFDADRIAALLNKVPDSGAPSGSAEPPSVPTKARGPAAGAPEGRDSVLTASQRSLLGAMMKRAVSRCWNINSGLEGIDRLVIDVEVRLKPDGRLAQQPRITNSGQGPLFSDAANSAIRALVQCEPYDLPAEFYEGGWDHMVVTFDPQRMF